MVPCNELAFPIPVSLPPVFEVYGESGINPDKRVCMNEYDDIVLTLVICFFFFSCILKKTTLH